jgi:hypothetical protein
MNPEHYCHTALLFEKYTIFIGVLLLYENIE